MKYFRIITLFLFVGVGTMASAQSTYNDTVRTRSWSAHLLGGISLHHGMHGDQYVGKGKPAPVFELGFAYHFSPAWRLAFSMGYTNLLTVGHFTATLPASTSATMVGDCTNRNMTHLFVSDLLAEYNLLDIEHQRKNQRRNLWVGIGLGYLRGWNTHDTIAEFKSATSDDVQWVEHRIHYNKGKAICVPIAITYEQDITPEWVLGVTGQCRALLSTPRHMPRSTWHLAAVVRYNWGGRRTRRDEASGMMLQKLLESYRDQARYRDQLRQATADQNRLVDDQELLRYERDSLAKENLALINTIIDLRDERATLREELAEKESLVKKLQKSAPQTTTPKTTPKAAEEPTVIYEVAGAKKKTPQPATPAPAQATTQTPAVQQPTAKPQTYEVSHTTVKTETPAVAQVTAKTETPVVQKQKEETPAQTKPAAAAPVASQTRAAADSVRAKPRSNIGDTCIYFDVNSSAINAKGMGTIQAVAEVLKANPKKKIFIIGYSSSTGNADYNLRLSQDRIYAVRKALKRAGVRSNQILGDRANGKSHMGSGASNRRVSILIK